MGAQTDQFQAPRIRQPVDQHQIRLDVAIAMVLPFPCRRVIVESLWKGRVIDQECNHGHEIGIEGEAVLTLALALIVHLESCGATNRPHGDRSTGSLHRPP